MSPTRPSRRARCARPHRGNVHRPLDLPVADRRHRRAGRSDLVRPLQPRLVRRPAARAFARRFPRIDLALLPIGAYEPRWFMAQQHMNPQEAVRAHLDLRPRRSLGMHFGAFRLTDGAIDAPVLALREARAEAGLAEAAFDVLGFGETREYAAT